MFTVTKCIGGWQVRFETVTAPPIATFEFEADARMFAAAKEAQRRQLVAAARSEDPWGLCAARVDEAYHGH
jgi:hypothetical protein